jgi:hypothetical protein
MEIGPYIDKLNKVQSLLNKVRESIYTRDMETAYKKLDLMTLGTYKLSRELRKLK